MKLGVVAVVIAAALSGCVEKGGGGPAPSENDPPVVTFSAPGSNETVVPPFFVNGTAQIDRNETLLVQVRFNGGDWLNAQGSKNWSHRVEDMPLGDLLIEARALVEGGEWGETVPLWINVTSPPPEPTLDRGADIESVSIAASWNDNKTMNRAMNLSMQGYGRSLYEPLIFNGTMTLVVDQILPPSPCGDDLVEPVSDAAFYFNIQDSFANETVNVTIDDGFNTELGHEIGAGVFVNKTGRTHYSTYILPGLDEQTTRLFEEGMHITGAQSSMYLDAQTGKVNVDFVGYNGSPGNPCRFSGWWSGDLYLEYYGTQERVGFSSQSFDYTDQGQNNSPHTGTISPDSGWQGDSWYVLEAQLHLNRSGDTYQFEHRFYVPQ